ncbi:hypothetical protein IQ238_04270 [Pleurocapsales cyanobacterium LEGE 06147]|nr:hypothetical protein [Pleurocapsales cyanobacterium LEGE 06147]
MKSPMPASENQFERDQKIWSSLKKAIANSSGFRRWQREQNISLEQNLDEQLRRYLQETLATLAY